MEREEVCEELRKRIVDVCCLQMRWTGRGSRMLWVEGRTFHLLWSGNGDAAGGVGVIVKELCQNGDAAGGVGVIMKELCRNVVTVRMVSDRKMVVV